MGHRAWWFLVNVWTQATSGQLSGSLEFPPCPLPAALLWKKSRMAQGAPSLLGQELPMSSDRGYKSCPPYISWSSPWWQLALQAPTPTSG